MVRDITCELSEGLSLAGYDIGILQRNRLTSHAQTVLERFNRMSSTCRGMAVFADYHTCT